MTILLGTCSPNLLSSAGDQPLSQLTEGQDTHYLGSPQTLQLMSWTPHPPPSTPDLTGITSLNHTLAGHSFACMCTKAMCNFLRSLKDTRDFENLLYESLSQKGPAFGEASGGSTFLFGGDS